VSELELEEGVLVAVLVAVVDMADVDDDGADAKR
jgi:hypothetical protein